jgi:hypothetical protein
MNIELEPKIWTEDHFKRLIIRTFVDYHPNLFNLEKIVLEDYLKIIREQDYCAKYGSYLEENKTNILTLKTMPWLDIGDLPSSYDNKKEEID